MPRIGQGRFAGGRPAQTSPPGRPDLRQCRRLAARPYRRIRPSRL